MASTRIIYSKNELLALAPLADSITLPDDVLAKFNIIEVNDSTPIARRRDVDRDGNNNNHNNNNNNNTENHGVAGANASHNAASATMANHHHNASSSYKNAGQTNASVDNDGSVGNNSNINAGQTDRRGYNINNNNTQVSGFYSNNNNNNNNSGYNGLYNRDDNGRRGQMTDRFSVPSRNWRGNRDIETFEEGYKYELERNAAQQRHVMETMQREDEKKEQVQESQMAKANKLAEEAATAAAASTATTSTSSSMIGSKEHEHDEIEKLLANITTADNGRAKVARSRFFNPSSETSDKPDSVINKFGQPANGAGTTGQSSFFGLTTSTSSGLKDLMLHKMTNTNNGNYMSGGGNTANPEYNNNNNNNTIKSSEANLEMYNSMNKSSGNVMHGTNFHLDHNHNLTSLPLMTNQTSSNHSQSAALAFAPNQTSRPENIANTTEPTDKVHDERMHLHTPHTENNTAGNAAGTNNNVNVLSTNTKMNATPQM